MTTDVRSTIRPRHTLVRTRLPLAVALTLAVAASGVMSSVVSGSPETAELLAGDRLFRDGLQAFSRGAFEAAITAWREAARAIESDGNTVRRATVLLHLAQAYQSLGQHTEAILTLDRALDLARKSGDPSRVAVTLAALGAAHLAAGSTVTAEQPLREALARARERADLALAARVINDLGNLLVQQLKVKEALEAYNESISLARQGGLPALTARPLANSAAVLRAIGDPHQARERLDLALSQFRALGPSHDTAYGLINVALGYRDLRSLLPPDHAALSRTAASVLSEAAALAETLHDPRAASYALGYLGRLYEEDGQYDDALALTRKAILAAQRANAPESLFRWQWQSGRLLRVLDRTDDSISAYRRAVETVQAIRPELSASSGGAGGAPSSFRVSIGPVYFEFVDLLTQQAASLTSPEQVASRLTEARTTIERFKVAELRDYFRDDCVELALARKAQIESVGPTAVIVYPIILPDRLAIIVSSGSALKQVTVNVTERTLTEEVRMFRRLLEKRTTNEYLPHAQQLYQWLIRPIEPEVARADTVVFVPDGALRTIPMAALHDGQDFLIRRVAVASTPGLDLTDPRPIRRDGLKVLAAGLTEAVQGFPPLPNVASELEAIRNLFPSTILVDKDLRTSTLEARLGEASFTILHIASHAEFSSDVDKTFLLMFDDKLTMNQLAQSIGSFRFRADPIELLTLSACETAAGDDRAALGLAGVAIKAGARSALATLWFINDEASARLVEEFYRQLKTSGVSRARALQQAQSRLIDDPRYEHPGLWSSFLLINNWL